MPATTPMTTSTRTKTVNCMRRWDVKDNHEKDVKDNHERVGRDGLGSKFVFSPHAHGAGPDLRC
jgi:hypothetical protein